MFLLKMSLQPKVLKYMKKYNFKKDSPPDEINNIKQSDL